MLVEAADQGSRLRSWRGRRCGDAQEGIWPSRLNEMVIFWRTIFAGVEGPHCPQPARDARQRSENGIVGVSQGARFVPATSPARGGCGLCETPAPYAGGSSSRASRAGPKEDSMKPANIALIVTAIAQLIAAFAATIGAIRCGP